MVNSKFMTILILIQKLNFIYFSVSKFERQEKITKK